MAPASILKEQQKETNGLQPEGPIEDRIDTAGSNPPKDFFEQIVTALIELRPLHRRRRRRSPQIFQPRPISCQFTTKKKMSLKDADRSQTQATFKILEANFDP